MTPPTAHVSAIAIRRRVDGVRVNIPHAVQFYTSAFDYGKRGAGASELALNVLEYALTANGHRGMRLPCFRGSCYQLAWDAHQDYASAVIASLPAEGADLVLDDVDRWLTRWRQTQASKPASLPEQAEDVSSTARVYVQRLNVDAQEMQSRITRFEDVLGKQRAWANRIQELAHALPVGRERDTIIAHARAVSAACDDVLGADVDSAS